MPRTPASEEQKAVIRSKIRKAAIDVYRREGLANITARAIAVQASVSVGTIYAYFGSLPELMQSLWERPVEQFEDRLRSTSAKQQSSVAKIEALLLEYLKFAQENPELYRASFLFVRPTSAPSPTKRELESSAFITLLVDAIADGQGNGVIRKDDPILMAQLLWASLHGVIALPVNIDRFKWHSDEQLQVSMLEMLMENIRLPD